jgi:hypothetical protein
MSPKPWQRAKTCPADWRLGVTVCIAMMANSGKELVLVSDSKVAFGDYSADDAVLKNTPFLYPWLLLFAGDDISYAKPIMSRANARASEIQKKEKRQLPGSEVAEILQEEMEVERSRIIEASVLARYGFTAETFRINGKTLCAETLYNDLIYKISQIGLSLQFLLCGIPMGKDEAEIWMVSPDEPPQNFDRLAFWAIGSGANAAISSLSHSIHYHQGGRFSDTSRVLYLVLAAKFMAETAKDVGKGTFVVTVDHENKMKFVSWKKIKEVGKIWEKRGAPRVPKGIEDVIKEGWHLIEDAFKD